MDKVIEAIKGATRHELYMIKHCVNTIIELADWDELAGMSVRREKLRCTSAEIYIADDGQHGYRAYIGGVSPTAEAFREWMRKRLDESVGERLGVEIVLEW